MIITFKNSMLYSTHLAIGIHFHNDNTGLDNHIYKYTFHHNMGMCIYSDNENLDIQFDKECWR